jgi:hexosaminidase
VPVKISGMGKKHRNLKIKSMKSFLLSFRWTMIFSMTMNFSFADMPIVPQPLKSKTLGGNLAIPMEITCEYSSQCANEAAYLKEVLLQRFNTRMKSSSGSYSSSISLKINEKEKDVFGDEGYQLYVSSEGISIKAAKPAGVFYGIQSLIQLIEKDSNDRLLVPYVEIYDQPRFKWRALLLDEARTFQGMDVVKQLLDEMAALKMNVFHWHLTDDQGWRVELKKYPELVKINSPKTLSEDLSKDNKGYYTQDEIREIVDYALRRHIMIVPEIEMPGHASAAIAAYPWLGVDKEPIEMPTKVTGIFLNNFDVTDPRVMKFIQNVLNEVKTLFPGGIIHIGGDEVNFSKWKNSAAVNAFMANKRIDTPADLQIWFTNKISAYLKRKKVRMMGWNDIMGHKLHDYEENLDQDYNINLKLSPQTIVHFWKGDLKLVKETVANGYDVVNSYHVYTYIDYPYSSIDLQKAYGFDPVPDGLDPEYENKIIGLGCQMWGSSVCTIETIEKLHPQVFPRIAAYAEVGWVSRENKNFERFKNKLPMLIERWRSQGIRSIGPINGNGL